jgi:hypothetical protein
MTCPKHETQEEYAHCNKVTLFEIIAKNAKAVVDGRRKLMSLMGTGKPWDDQQKVVQENVARLEASVKDAEIASLLHDSSEK